MFIAIVVAVVVELDAVSDAYAAYPTNIATEMTKNEPRICSRVYARKCC
jgi:hypothetical protein